MVNDKVTRRLALTGIVCTAAGAAATSITDLIYPDKSSARAADGFFYEVAHPSTPVFNENTTPNGYHLMAPDGSKLKLRASGFVTPEMLDGNLHMAAAYAAVFKVTLMTGPTEYEITTAFQPHDLTWISNGTRIKQMSTASGVAVLRPKSNVKHIGSTYLYLPDAEDGTANRAHVVFGNWATGVGFENFHFDEFVLEGGHSNCNGFSVTGGSHNVRGRRIDAGTSTKIGRVFLAHWANFDEHYNSGGTYQHAPGAGPTTHPHDIVIEEVVGDLNLSAGDFCALWCVSAGYDIHVGRVGGSCINTGAGPGELVLFTAGDLGFAHATEELREAGMWGLTVGSIKGKCSHSALLRLGRALYHEADSMPQPAESYFAKIQDSVGNVDVYNAIGNNLSCGVDGTNGYGKTRIDSIRAVNFRSAVNCSNYTRDVIINKVESINNRNQAIQLAGSGNTEADWPSGIKIGTLHVNGTGAGESTADAAKVATINKVVDLRIKTIVVDKLKDMEMFSSAALHISANVRSIAIEKIVLNWMGNGQTVAITNAAAGDRSVYIGHVHAPHNLIPVLSA